MKTTIRVLAALALAAVALPVASVRAQATCAPESSGGDWRSYSHDLANTRNQDAEKTINAANAAHLTKAWAFKITTAEGTGNFQSTPTIADGCIFAATNQGEVVALNADTGELVWKRLLSAGGIAQGVFGVTVQNGRVYANVSTRGAPFALSLDQETGETVWQSEPIDTQEGAYLNSSAVVHRNYMFVGFSASEGNEEERGGYAILDKNTGQILKKVFPISDDAFAQGQGGAGVWATAVVDPETDYLFVGTSNPYTREYEHRYSNAIVKIDLRQARGRFGEIVDAYKGDIEQYYPPLAVATQTPACKAQEIPRTIDYPQCGQLDIDFGASPNLFRDAGGAVLIGELQKSGVYHAVYADTMQKAWSAFVGAPGVVFNAATSAVDDDAVYVAGTPGAVVYALDKTTGAYKWASPIVDGVHYEAVSVANGVVYAVDTKGVLNAFDAATGRPVAVKPMIADTADPCVPLGGGAAIARNKVYSVCDVGVTGTSWLVAYSL